MSQADLDEDEVGVVIAYRKSDREVYWWYTDEADSPHTNLHTRMAEWLVKGETFEILEYHPRGLDRISRVNERAVWWDEQLRELGYDIYGEPDR